MTKKDPNDQQKQDQLEAYKQEITKIKDEIINSTLSHAVKTVNLKNAMNEVSIQFNQKITGEDGRLYHLQFTLIQIPETEADINKRIDVMYDQKKETLKKLTTRQLEIHKHRQQAEEAKQKVTPESKTEETKTTVNKKSTIPKSE